MKRLVISLLLFAVVTAVCLWGSGLVNSSYKKICSELESAEQLMKTNDFSGARKCAVRAEKIYKESEKLLAAFVSHGVLDEVGVKLSAVPPFADENSKEEFFSHCAQARVALAHMHNDHRFMTQNLF